jgi:hypothetical protein
LSEKVVKLDLKTWKRISKIITDYPEFGYKTVDEFIDDAAIDLLNLKMLQLTHLQTWRRGQG